MKYFDWILSGLLIFFGILCMALSSMPRIHADYISFFHLCLQICVYFTIPYLIIEAIYFLFFRKRKK